MERNDQFLDLGTWLGRKQAFSAMSGRCTAAGAECPRNIREKKLYRACGVTWDVFCREYAGMSRSLADQLIRQLEEFGAGYFRLAEVAKITPGSYRLIAPSVSEEGVTCGGEMIRFTPENAGRIAAAVEQLRVSSKPAPEPDGPAPRLERAQKRVAGALVKLERIAGLTRGAIERQPWQAFLDEAICRLTRLRDAWDAVE